jgi:hypothetical protein
LDSLGTATGHGGLRFPDLFLGRSHPKRA